MKHPDDADALCLSARAHLRAGRREEALSELRSITGGWCPNSPTRVRDAKLLFALDRFPAALAEIETLLARDAANPLFRRMKADILRITGEDVRSLALCEDLVEEDPARPQSWIACGHALRTTGRREEAVAAYREAIARRPCSGLAWWGLAGMRTVPFGEGDISVMEAQLARGDVPADDRIALQTPSGEAFEDAGPTGDSMYALYAAGNAALRLRLDDDNPRRLAARAASMKAFFTPDMLRRGGGCEVPDPIFIVGQPRSGSTLIEQILSSHSAVEGTAELPYIRALARRPRGTRRLSRDSQGPLGPAELKALGEDYLQSASAHRKSGRPFFIDKAPANFLALWA